MARPKGGGERLVGTVADYRPAERKCLWCGRGFSSQGPADRKCGRCRKAPPKLLPRREAEGA
jgi:tRNA(Ile2) C34 agmatinyltransferase TiaS